MNFYKKLLIKKTMYNTGLLYSISLLVALVFSKGNISDGTFVSTVEDYLEINKNVSDNKFGNTFDDYLELNKKISYPDGIEDKTSLYLDTIKSDKNLNNKYLNDIVLNDANDKIKSDIVLDDKHLIFENIFEDEKFSSSNTNTKNQIEENLVQLFDKMLDKEIEKYNNEFPVTEEDSNYELEDLLRDTTDDEFENILKQREETNGQTEAAPLRNSFMPLSLPPSSSSSFGFSYLNSSYNIPYSNITDFIIDTPFENFDEQYGYGNYSKSYKEQSGEYSNSDSNPDSNSDSNSNSNSDSDSKKNKKNKKN